MRIHLTDANKDTTFPSGRSDTFNLNAGTHLIIANGTFGGTCAIALQYCPGFGVDDATDLWVTVPNASFTANGALLVDLPHGKYSFQSANIHSTTDLIASVSE